jgi:dTDP-4-amino-4,6-dideoxygalactose transaminase
MNDGDRETIPAFESAFAERVGCRDAIAVTFARLGLRYALDALGLAPGDEVILSPLTCRVVVLALQSAAFRPVYADIKPSSGLNLDGEGIERHCTKRTRAILFQHTYGTSTGIEEVADVARQRGIPLIEDCAQCLPPGPAGERAGSRGEASIWSHNYRKPLPVGAGGMITTSGAGLAARIRQRRDAGEGRSRRAELAWRMMGVAHEWLLRPGTYWMLWSLQRRVRGDHRAKTLEDAIEEEVTSLPVRISTWQAQRGFRGLASADQRIRRSLDLSRRYANSLGDLNTIALIPGATDFPLYYFPVLARRKHRLLDAARQRGLELIAWPTSTPIYPIEREIELRQCEYEPGSCPNAEARAGTLLGLPVDLRTTDNDAGALIELLRLSDGWSAE